MYSDDIAQILEQLQKATETTHKAVVRSIETAPSIAPIVALRETIGRISRMMDATHSAISQAQIDTLCNVTGSVKRALEDHITTLSNAAIAASEALDTTRIAHVLSASVFNSGAFSQFLQLQSFMRLVRVSGWLPYYTISFHDIEDCGQDTALIDARITSVYRTQWDSIRNDILSRVGQYRVSVETKDTFRQALDAHSVGHYQCVSRVLFPDIEKELRSYVPKKRAGSGKRLAQEVMCLAYVSGTSGPRKAYGWILYSQLMDHLYENIDDGNIDKFRRDYVPNRHAAIHGLVHYGTHKHSMNMIIMADYIFQVLTSMADALDAADRDVG